MFDAYLLDFDGTFVVNSENIHMEATKTTLRDASQVSGVTFDEDNFSKVWINQLGKGIENFYNVFLGSIDLCHKTHLESVFEDATHFNTKYEETYFQTIANDPSELEVRDGIYELLEKAKESNTPVAIVSNAKQSILEATLDAIGLRDQISLILGIDKSTELHCSPKPSGQPYEKACELLGVSASNCYGIEDTQSGLASLCASRVGYKVFCGGGQGMTYEFVQASSSKVIGVNDNILGSLPESHHNHVPNTHQRPILQLVNEVG